MITQKLMTHCLKIDMFQLLPCHNHNYKYKVNIFIFIGNKYRYLNNLIVTRVIRNKYIFKIYNREMIGKEQKYRNKSIEKYDNERVS